MNQEGLLLFIPAYRCEPQIQRVLKQLTPEITREFREIIVVDNISSDKTADVASHYIANIKFEHPPIKVVRNPVNMGLGGTHKMAFEYAIQNGFKGCVILHGDDQGDIKDFSSKLSKFKTEEKFVFGARFHPQSRLINYSHFRIFGNIVFNYLAQLILKRSIYDLGGSGLNYFPVSLLKLHPFWKYADDLTFHVYLLVNALRMNQSLEFVSISWREDDQISNARLFRQARKILSILMIALGGAKVIEDQESKFTSPPALWEVVIENEDN